MDIRNVDLNLLVALDALLAERSVSRAATRLHLSQPATSAVLARLRELFGDPLLLRTARGMLPTARALELGGPVKQVLAEINRLVQPQTAFDPAHADLTFTLSASDYVEYALLPALVDYIESKAPGARLEVKPIDFSLMDKQLESGEVDVCVTSYHNASPGLHARALYTERLVCVVRRNHPEVEDGITIDQFCRLAHVSATPSGGGTFVRLIDDALKAARRGRHIRLKVPHFLMVPEIIARSDMVAVLPERLARGYARKLSIFEPPLKLPDFDIAAIWHERTHSDPAQQWLRQVLVDLIEKQAPR
jgi:DNA-binding transcriptional LysR family regulator